MMHTLRYYCAPILFTALLLSGGAMALSDTVLLLHTNDLHDHIRPSDDKGGLAAIAGYVREVRRDRNDALLLDAGDVMEKGDMAAYLSKSQIMYQAMGRIGYDALAIGNHDFTYGIPNLHTCKQAGNFELLCLNLTAEKPGEAPPFPGSKIFDVDGVKVGVIGLTISGKRPDVLSFEDTQTALAEEARKLDEQAHLVVVTAHLGPKSCATLMRGAPEVDIFIAGHQHGVLREPVRVEETGGLIVEAGSYTSHVGLLELEVDLDSEAFTILKHAVTPMEHGTVHVDSAMEDWLRQEEDRYAPNSRLVIGKANRLIGNLDAAQYLAEALRFKAKADIGLCLPQKIIRNPISAGEVDMNALFKAPAPWAQPLVSVDMTGAEILTYLLSREVRAEQTTWSGFNAKIKYSRDKDCEIKEHSLDPNATYHVAVCKIEWETKILPKLETTPDRRVEPCTYTLLDAAEAYTRNITGQGLSLDEAIRTLTRAAKGA